MRWPFRRPLEPDDYEHPLAPAAPIATRRIELTADDIRAGQKSWLRLDHETGRLETVLYFARGPSYAAALPADLSRQVIAFTDAAMFALEPLLEEDINLNGGTTT